MSKQKKIDPSYKTMPARERYDRWLLAAARGDKDERVRLIMTCPRKMYPFFEIDFWRRADGSVRVATYFEMALVQELRAFDGVHVRHSLSLALVEQGIDAEPIIGMSLAELDALGGEKASRVRAPWVAFTRLCKREHLVIDRVLAGCAPSAKLSVEEMRPVLEDDSIDPDSALLAEMTRAMDSLWEEAALGQAI